MAMHQRGRYTLAQMEIGQAGIIVGIQGGRGLIRRLEALGIRPGKKVTKISAALFRGPVTLRVDNSQVAVGFGMAKRIIVELG